MKIDATIPPSQLLRHLLMNGYRVRPAGAYLMVGPAKQMQPDLIAIIRRKRHLLRPLAGFRPSLTALELRP